MKSYILLFWLSLVTCIGFSQDVQRERLKALRVAFITERLSLTTAEAEKFWPIYNRYDDKVFQLRNVDLLRLKRDARNDFSTLSDEEANRMLDRLEDIEQQLFAERKTLVASLRKVIPARKVILLKSVEDDFNRELLERLKERREKRLRGN